MKLVDAFAFCARCELRLGDPALELGLADAGHSREGLDFRVLAFLNGAIDEPADLFLGHGQAVGLVQLY